MAKREEVVEESAPAKKEGFHWWDREFFIQNMGHLVERLRQDETLIPCVREQDGGLFFYTMGKVQTNGDDGFNQSHVCPPFCPPGWP